MSTTAASQSTESLSSIAAAALLEEALALREQLHGLRLRQWPEAMQLLQALQQRMVVPLAELHRHYGPYPLFRQGRDQHTPLHQQFYAAHRQVAPLYQALAARLAGDVIGEPCHIQQIPTYRFGLPGNRWVGNFHHDSDFGHPPYELNAVLALTPMHKSAALQVEEHPGSYRYIPLNLAAGEVVLFNHIDRRHGCRRNREGVSVSSIDFRFVPQRFAAAAFQETRHSLNTRVAMAPGSYFTAKALPAQLPGQRPVC